ncbi:MAG: flavodoxin domain-containing protein [Paludibacteraceae bacterium]
MIKTAIIYSTTNGATSNIVKYISDKLTGEEVTIIKLKRNSKVELAAYDKIILGGSIYLGDIQPVMSRFCNAHLDVLLTKTIGLFLCGIEPELVRQDSQLEMAFPKKLYNHAIATAFVGGEIIFEKLNPTQKFISKNFFKINETTQFIRYDLIDIFVYQMLSA